MINPISACFEEYSINTTDDDVPVVYGRLVIKEIAIHVLEDIRKFILKSNENTFQLIYDKLWERLKNIKTFLKIENPTSKHIIDTIIEAAPNREIGFFFISACLYASGEYDRELTFYENLFEYNKFN